MQKNTAFAKRHYHALFKLFSSINFLFVMRLSFCFLAMLLFSFTVMASFKTFGQSIENTEVTMHTNNEPLKVALQKLQEQSGFSFFYPSAKVNAYQHVTIDGKVRTVAETLKLLLGNTNLEYHQNGNKVILSEQETNFSPAKTVEAASRITGIVRDENNQPLPGVSVRSKSDNSLSTATDQNGHFHLDVESDDDLLVFSFIGYKTQTLSIKGVTSLDIHLQPSAGTLDEVQIMGYSSTTRRDNTGSVSSISAKDINSQPVSNPLAAMQGRLPGVQITQNNGLPGSGFRVQIRGIGSLSSGTLPLYVVDGVPLPFTMVRLLQVTG